MTQKHDLQIIADNVCRHFNISLANLKSKSRKKRLVYARQVFCYLGYQHTEAYLSTIGKFLNRTHCNVLYSVNTIEYQRNFYKYMQEDINIIINSDIAMPFIPENINLMIFCSKSN